MGTGASREPEARRAREEQRRAEVWLVRAVSLAQTARRAGGGGVSATGGRIGSGGASAAGGATGTGGRAPGGGVGAGGSSASGGTSGSGGVSSTGGASTGGASGTGGSGGGGSGGSGGSSGRAATGGSATVVAAMGGSTARDAAGTNNPEAGGGGSGGFFIPVPTGDCKILPLGDSITAGAGAQPGVYRPNCWEDIDISYRAQKRGLKVLYEPKSLLYHKGAATLNYARHKEIKNELLFMWKNLTDIRMLMSHCNQLPHYFRYGKHSNRPAFLIGYLWALYYFIPALINRFREKKYLEAPDTIILNRSIHYYRNFKRNNYVHAQKKTILLITPFMIYPLNCGGKIRIYNLCKQLSKKYNLILLSLIHHEKEREYAAYLKKEIFNEVHMVHPKTPSNEFLFPRRYQYSFSSFLIEKLKEIQENAAIDLVQIESNELLYLTKYIEYIPIVYTEHDISILSYRKSYYKKSMHASLFDLIDYFKVVRYHDHIYRRINKVITLSKEDKKVIKAFSPRTDCSLIRTGVDLGHFNFLEKSGKNKSLVFVGHYQHYPNEEAAIYFCRHIFPLVKKAIPEVTLRLIGSDPTEAIMGLSEIEGVKVTGTVPDVNPYLQEASVFVCAFRRSAGIKGKVLEAMATGTPVVSTTRGAYGINAADGESILIADNPGDFAAKVIKLLGDNRLYKKIARNARALVEQEYDWDNIAEQLDKVYRAITEEEKARPHTKRISVQDIIEQTDRVVGLSLDYLSEQNNQEINTNPEELHIELTHLCNSKCIMCDLWDYHQRNNKSVNDELSFEDIEKFVIKESGRLKAVKTVVLSGGEPFLRSDLVIICSLIGKVFPQAAVGILTNAINTENVISKSKAILNTSKIKSLWLGSSLDGIGAVYDKIRGLPGGFARFVETIQRLKSELPGINLSATFVLTPFNLDQLLPCWEFADSNGLDFFAQFGVTKQARAPEVFQWRAEDLARIKEDTRLIIEKIINKNTGLEDFYNSLTAVGDKINILTKIYYWAHLVDFQQTCNRFFHSCNAGFKFAMLDPYGNMFFCPLLKDKTIGNIKDKDIEQLWVSDEAENIREFIRSGKCSCWLVCTVFPIVSQALSLYANKASSGPSSQVLNRHVAHGSGSNIDLNNQEYKDKKSILQSTPQGLTLGTNYGCNADCLFCLGGDYKPFSLNLYKNYFEPRLGSILGRCGYISFCGMGELLLAPEIEKFLTHINDKMPDKNKVLTTNGLALNNKILDRITKSQYSLQVSLHASNPALHEYLTGIKGGFEKIIGQIRLIVSRRKNRQSPYITLVFVVNTINIENLPDFMDLAASLGVDCVQCNYLTIFKPAHIKLSCFFKQEITNQMFDIAAEKAKGSKISLLLPPSFCADKYSGSICSDPWKNIYVDTEGAVLPCCYSGEHFGELANEDILSVWNNAKFIKIRTGMASGNPLMMCRYCLNNRQDNVNLLNAHLSSRPEVQKTILEQN